MSRVVFYSVEDGASGKNLIDAEALLKDVDVNQTFLINDLLEFRNVQLYFENEMYLKEWFPLSPDTNAIHKCTVQSCVGLTC